MSKHFYNTINLAGQELATEQAKNINQEDMILRFFQNNPNERFSPSELHRWIAHAYSVYPPITSIRRGLTNLTNRGLLIKTEFKVKGMYHLPEHTWTLNINAA
jgi:hypothetical protein